LEQPDLIGKKPKGEKNRSQLEPEVSHSRAEHDLEMTKTEIVGLQIQHKGLPSSGLKKK
jgi:hypothetical protein